MTSTRKNNNICQGNDSFESPPKELFDNFAIDSDDSNVRFNWSKTTVLASSNNIFVPSTIDELQNLVRQNPKLKLKPVGSGLSYEAIHSISNHKSGDALLVDLSKLRGRIATFEDGSVKYYAATQLDFVYDELIRDNRMLPVSPGVIGVQTIAGAISTGTHGQGLFQSTLCDTVNSLTIMIANGDILEIPKSHPDFGGFVCGLGVLGILLDVTLATVPNCIMKCTKLTANYKLLQDENDKLNKTHLFAKSWWFAWTGETHIWLVDPASPEEIQLYEQNNCQTTTISSNVDTSMNATIDKTLATMAAQTKEAAPTTDGRFDTVRRFQNASNIVGNVYQILCKGIPAPQINCEIGIPIANVKPALEELRLWEEENRGRMHYPFILRYTGASKAWLSASYDQEICWIGFLVYLASDGSYLHGSMDFMRDIQNILAKHGGLPHLGKHFIPSLFDFTKLPRWNDFLNLKKRVDPTGRFDNAWLNAGLFLPRQGNRLTSFL